MQSPISLGYKSYVLYLSARAFISTTTFWGGVLPKTAYQNWSTWGRVGFVPIVYTQKVLPSAHDARVREGVKRSPTSFSYGSNVQYIRVREELRISTIGTKLSCFV